MWMPSVLSRVLAKLARSLPASLGFRLDVLRSWIELPELRAATRLCKPGFGTIDVGANIGIFAWWLARNSDWCIAFEPNPQMVSHIQTVQPGLNVQQVGLSDQESKEILAIPIVRGIPYSGFASMMPTTALAAHPKQILEVPTRTLDSYNLRQVGFIKIDVEGFEERVLKGATNTILMNRPNLLIEIEERHNPGGYDRICAFLGNLGYARPHPVEKAPNNFEVKPISKEPN